MVKQNARTGKNIVGFAIVCHLPESRRFRNGIRAPRPEGGLLSCGCTAQVAETFARTGIVKLYWFPGEPDCLQEIECREMNAFLGFNRLFKGERNRRLTGKIVNLVRLRLE